MTSSKKAVLPSWSADPRPRERVLADGARHLNNAELVALCLGAGMPGEDAVSLAARLIKQFGGVEGLLGASVDKLLACRGLGDAKVAALKAVHELSCRRDETQLANAAALSDPTAVTRYLRRRIGHLEREVFGCLFLDTRHRPMCFEILFYGSINRAHVHTREILKRAIQLNAAALILAHNHPSGIPEPSSADLNLTRELKDLLHRIDVALLDHIVVAPGSSVSLAQRGLIT